MKLLLDTCTFLWLAGGSAELSRAAREAFVDERNDVYLSTVSAWEIAIKHSLGRLPLPKRPELYIPEVRENGHVETLPLDEEAALYFARLPRLHGDPFDRMLVAQAVVHGMVLVTPDEAIQAYAVRTLW